MTFLRNGYREPLPCCATSLVPLNFDAESGFGREIIQSEWSI
jgi:hypothetical protein